MKRKRESTNKTKTNTIVPCPVQDLVDAFALVWLGMRDRKYSHGIGLDVSSKSPGIVIFQTNIKDSSSHSQSIKFYFFAQTKRQLGLQTTWTTLVDSQQTAISLHCLGELPNNKDSHGQRCVEIGTKLLLILNQHQNIQHAWQEDYAFHIGKSRSPSDLHEIGGIVKFLVRSKKIPLTTMPISTLKKQFSGSGKADKHDMLLKFEEIVPSETPFIERFVPNISQKKPKKTKKT